MKEVRNQKQLEEITGMLQGVFQIQPPVLRFLQFEKGELLNHPLKPLTQFLIVAKGNITIYDISDNGGIHYVSHAGRGTLLGDMEFCGVDDCHFYTEAAEQLLCIAIPFAENRAVLENDPVFLRFALRQLAQKLSLSTIDTTMQTLEEKVLLYLEKIQPDHTIYSINEAVHSLHCSHRQLQRVLKKLCDTSTLRKIGKGKYCLQ